MFLDTFKAKTNSKCVLGFRLLPRFLPVYYTIYCEILAKYCQIYWKNDKNIQKIHMKN